MPETKEVGQGEGSLNTGPGSVQNEDSRGCLSGGDRLGVGPDQGAESGWLGDQGRWGPVWVLSRSRIWPGMLFI